MSDSVKISIIMCVYNEKEEWLHQAINSILNQTFSDFEFIIILDNPQNKKLENIIKKYEQTYERIRFYLNSENIGLAKSLNKGIGLAKYPYIARMDADDISDINRLKIQIECLLSNNYDLVGSDISFIDEKGNCVNKDTLLVESYQDIKRMLKYNNVLNHPTWLFKKESILKINGYIDIPYCEDYDLICRLISSGGRVYNINQKLLKYRLRGNGVSISNKYYQLVMSNKIRKFYINNKINKSYIFERYTFSKEQRYLNKFNESYNLYHKSVLLLKEKKYLESVVNLIKSIIRSKTMLNLIYRNMVLKIYRRI